MIQSIFGRMAHCDSSVAINVTIMAMINRYEACHTGVLNSVHLLDRELMRGFPIINAILIIIIHHTVLIVLSFLKNLFMVGPLN